jgi:parallel beta-helix repeat protein
MMRTPFTAVIVFLLTAASMVAASPHQATAISATLVVPDDFQTIQEAIDNAVAGDTVFVRVGTYYEHVVVNQTVSLLGEDVSTTIVDGSGTGHVFAVEKDGVTITGFTVQHSGAILGNAGLWLNNVSLCSVSENRIRDNFAGIWLDGASGNRITANEIFANADDGIVFNHSHNNTISENHIALHEYFGIVMNWSHNNTISGNNVTLTIGPSHGDGINLWRSSGNRILQNHVYDNNRYGIRLEVESNTNTVAGNHISACLTGLQVYNYSSHNTLRDNHVANCSTGLELSRFVTDTALANNTVTGNGVGINLNSWSTSNTLAANHVADNTAGLQFTSAHQNEVCLNNLTGNDIGASVQFSQNNWFHGNTFLDNTQQTLVFAGYANAWDSDYPSGGNYWSDHEGDSDLWRGPHQNWTGSDGIGDHPYAINADNQDRYPLTKPVSGPAGDVDGDRDVDRFDISLMASVYRVVYPSPQYDRRCDLDLDGDIDLFDVVKAAGHYGTTW